MISRRSILLLGTVYADQFAGDREQIYEFLYERNYHPQLCEKAQTYKDLTALKRFIVDLANGQVLKHPDESVQHKTLQDTLLKLAEDILVYMAPAMEAWRKYKSMPPATTNAPRPTNTTNLFSGGSAIPSDYMLERERPEELQISLELDGYQFNGTRLLVYEVDVINTVQETGILHQLYRQVGLDESETAFHFLSLSDEHFIAKHWSDLIHQGRNFLEFTMAQAAKKWAAHRGIATPRLDKPVEVRAYLQTNDVLSDREREMLNVLYGLLSNTGGHPYIAANDEARLCMNMVLTYTQFILMRLNGKLKEPTPATP